jgi:hypothetical protein
MDASGEVFAGVRFFVSTNLLNHRQITKLMKANGGQRQVRSPIDTLIFCRVLCKWMGR